MTEPKQLTIQQRAQALSQVLERTLLEKEPIDPGMRFSAAFLLLHRMVKQGHGANAADALHQLIQQISKATVEQTTSVAGQA